MKIKILCSLLTAALVLSITGCGEQKQPEKQESDSVEKAGLESKIEEGWNEKEKCFVRIVRVPEDEKKPSLSTPRYQLEGMILALREFGSFIQGSVVPAEKGEIKMVSAHTFGSLQLKIVQEASTDNSHSFETFRRKTAITRGEEQLYLLEEDDTTKLTHRGKLLYSCSCRGNDIQIQDNVTEQDVNLFKSEMEANGLKISLIGCEKDEGLVRMAFSIQLQTSGKQ